eukprot:3264563-Pyramimonas_sp.AAC.1
MALSQNGYGRLLFVLPRSCVLCRAPMCFVCSAVLLLLPCSAVLLLLMCSAMLLCVMPCSYVFYRVPICPVLCVFCRALARSAVLLCVLPRSYVLCLFCRVPRAP